jgi:nephrocystin-3
MDNSKPIQNKNELRVFLSSTFRDMAHERDYLLTKIFPKVKRLARARGVEFTAVDLRWGVTEEEAKQGLVVKICLEEINRCKPFFLGFLGERYGWVPSSDDIDQYEQLSQHFPIVKASLDERLSVTEMEIRHGVLEAENKVEAVFYQRNRKLTEKLAKEQHNQFFESDDKTLHKLEKLKAKILASEHPVREYEDLNNFGTQVFEDVTYP